MTEPQQQAGTQDKTVIGGEPQFELSKYIGDDGALLDGWKEGLLPDDLRGEKFFDTLHDIKGVFKTVGHQAKRIGTGDKAVVIPDEKSSPEEIAAYRKARGVPDKPDGYKLPEIPPELKDYYDGPLMPEAVAELHKLGLNQTEFNTIMALDRKRCEYTENQLAEFEAQQEAEAEKIIERDFGGKDREVMTHQIHLAVDNLTKKWSPEKRATLFGENVGLNDPSIAELRPLIFEFMSDVGAMFKEGTMSESEAVQAGVRIEQEIQALRQSEAMKNPAHKDHEAAVKQLDALYHKLHPGK